MDFDTEIETLKQRLEELESNKKAVQEYNEKIDVNKNLEIVRQGIVTREEKVIKNNYSKTCIVAKFIDKDMIPPLQAIYNILHTFNERLDKLESSSSKNNTDTIDDKNKEQVNDISKKEPITLEKIIKTCTELSNEYDVNILLLDSFLRMTYYVNSAQITSEKSLAPFDELKTYILTRKGASFLFEKDNIVIYFKAKQILVTYDNIIEMRDRFNKLFA